MEIPGYRFVPARKKPGGFLLACEGVGRDPHRSLPPSHRKSASLGLRLETACAVPTGPGAKGAAAAGVHL